ncbi:major allergen I polypeptide chain 2-like [Eptesicus fuscus]|uniref:major allergen I polypeptide chain 2-like n=1 Tax=Eptesicus fuscus TaxID=29078 RepID=UPI002404751A|nr:major allergen I polypeptide chain 2-like [Eptesicus fuscus]
MKGTLLVLALLVTGELGIQRAETCPIFYGVFGALAVGSKFLLDVSLDLVHATEPEKVALEKIQDCYNEAGIESKILDLIVMGTITTSKECIHHAMDMLKKDVTELLN